MAVQFILHSVVGNEATRFCPFLEKRRLAVRECLALRPFSMVVGSVAGWAFSGESPRAHLGRNPARSRVPSGFPDHNNVVMAGAAGFWP